MRRIGEHAVVIGASMSGLLAARSLTQAYERVTVVDRDALPAGLQGRKAVPQGRHAHALLPHGLACLDALRRCRCYVVGDKRLPSANIDEHDLRRVLAPGFSPRVEVRELQGHGAQGYSSIVLAQAQRRENAARPRSREYPVRGLRSGIRISSGRGL